jgi:hypothetical protein
MTTVWITVRRRSIENIGSIPVLTNPLKFGHSFGTVNICAASDNLNKFVFDSGRHSARTAGEELKKKFSQSLPPASVRPTLAFSLYALEISSLSCQTRLPTQWRRHSQCTRSDGKKLTDS